MADIGVVMPQSMLLLKSLQGVEEHWLVNMLLTQGIMSYSMPLVLALVGFVLTLLDQGTSSLSLVARGLIWVGLLWLAALIVLQHPAAFFTVPWFLLLGLFRGPQSVAELRAQGRVK